MTPHGPRVLITGGSRGLGLAYGEALTTADRYVVLNQLRDGAFAREERYRLQALTSWRVFEIDANVIDAPAARASVDQAA